MLIILLKPDLEKFNTQSNLGPALFDKGFVNIIKSCVFWEEREVFLKAHNEKQTLMLSKYYQRRSDAFIENRKLLVLLLTLLLQGCDTQ